MSARDPRQIIISPVISEKALGQVQAHNQYSFRVAPDAHKLEIRDAVERIFDVTVTDVRTGSVKPKPKRRGASIGKKNGWK